MTFYFRKKTQNISLLNFRNLKSNQVQYKLKNLLWRKACDLEFRKGSSKSNVYAFIFSPLKWLWLCTLINFIFWFSCHRWMDLLWWLILMSLSIMFSNSFVLFLGSCLQENGSTSWCECLFILGLNIIDLLWILPSLINQNSGWIKHIEFLIYKDEYIGGQVTMRRPCFSHSKQIVL